MDWMTSFTSEDAKAQAEKAFSLPLGAASPLWLAYAGATAGAMTYWWMTRWMKPANLEAMSWPTFPQYGEALEKLAAAKPLTTALEAFKPDLKRLDPVTEAPEPDPFVAAVEPFVEAVEAVVETMTEAVKSEPDDLTVLVGIGPTLASKLGDLGVTTYADIAAWTEADVDKFDKQLKLLGRISRDAWIDQAKQLAEAAR